MRSLTPREDSSVYRRPWFERNRMSGVNRRIFEPQNSLTSIFDDIALFLQLNKQTILSFLLAFFIVYLVFLLFFTQRTPFFQNLIKLAILMAFIAIVLLQYQVVRKNLYLSNIIQLFFEFVESSLKKQFPSNKLNKIIR
jgi:hypothetical protein